MLTLIATLILLGVIFYFIGLIPMADPFPQIIKAVAILIALALVLNAFGIHVLPNFSLK